ncbi:MAG: HU family DNA-binding protein [Alphaproteobacteria bacterium]|nr:HU family DNA-binding protein [Alphaproteobacteria bacterium]
MSKQALSDAIKGATGCTVAQAGEAVDAMVDVIKKSLKKEGNFALVGFGTYKVAKRAARKGRNPKTGAEITIKASKTVRFKPSAALKSGL